MTNQEKDLKNAREYLDNFPMGLKNSDYVIFDDTEQELQRYGLDELLAKHIQWLEQKGVIKFTGKREDTEENNGLVKCKHCDRLNCKYNDSCIECGEPDYK